MASTLGGPLSKATMAISMGRHPQPDQMAGGPCLRLVRRVHLLPCMRLVAAAPTLTDPKEGSCKAATVISTGRLITGERRTHRPRMTAGRYSGAAGRAQ